MGRRRVRDVSDPVSEPSPQSTLLSQLLSLPTALMGMLLLLLLRLLLPPGRSCLSDTARDILYLHKKMAKNKICPTVWRSSIIEWENMHQYSIYSNKYEPVFFLPVLLLFFFLWRRRQEVIHPREFQVHLPVPRLELDSVQEVLLQFGIWVGIRSPPPPPPLPPSEGAANWMNSHELILGHWKRLN